MLVSVLDKMTQRIAVLSAGTIFALALDLNV